MFCAWCNSQMGYVHGHAACLDGSCPMFGLNQAECCDGETASTCPTSTATLAHRADYPVERLPSGPG